MGRCWSPECSAPPRTLNPPLSEVNTMSGAIRQFQIVEFLENAADAVVETLDHGGVNRIALLAGTAGLVLGDHSAFALSGMCTV